MPVLSVRVSEDLLARFDAAAALRGGRSALLGQLVEAASGGGSRLVLRGAAPPDGLRLMVRLETAEARHVTQEADRFSLPRAAWVRALVRRHAAGEPTFSKAQEAALFAALTELRRIGVNVNQIARALNTAVLEGRVLDLQLLDLAALRRELRAHLAAIGASLEGNLAYWDAPL